MSPQQILLVQTSWQKVFPIKEKAAELFYGRLFETDPSLKPMFKGNIADQGRKLMAMINMVVARLDRLEEIMPVVRDLARRHAGYGVTEKDYDTVGSALLWTLGAGLGDAFTGDVKEAWAEAYTVLADAMKAAGR